MKKGQILLVSGGLVAFLIIFFLGNTIPPKKKMPSMGMSQSTKPKSLTTEDVLAKAKSSLTSVEQEKITELENSVVRGDVKKQQSSVYEQLSDFWNQNHRNDLGAYYVGLRGKLENSEKNLTFAATNLVSQMLVSDSDPAMQNWLATQAKQFFDKALVLNPNNDSAKVGVGACYMFGNISDNPMQGILPVRAIAEKNPNNAYAQMILGLGGVKSGQYDKAIERFIKVNQLQPDNLEAILDLGEAYDRKGDKTNAIKWYKKAKTQIKLPEAQRELDDRISVLQQ